MIFLPSGVRIKPLAGFAGGWAKVKEGDSAEAIASQHTYQDWEPLEQMESRGVPLALDGRVQNG